MVIYRYVRLCRAMKGFVESVEGYVWLCRAMHGYVGQCRAMYGCVVLYRAMYGYI